MQHYRSNRTPRSRSQALSTHRRPWPSWLSPNLTSPSCPSTRVDSESPYTAFTGLKSIGIGEGIVSRMRPFILTCFHGIGVLYATPTGLAKTDLPLSQATPGRQRTVPRPRIFRWLGSVSVRQSIPRSRLPKYCRYLASSLESSSKMLHRCTERYRHSGNPKGGLASERYHSHPPAATYVVCASIAKPCETGRAPANEAFRILRSSSFLHSAHTNA